MDRALGAYIRGAYHGNPMNPYRQNPERPTPRDQELWEQSLRRLFCTNCSDAELAKGWEYPKCLRNLAPQACERAWWCAWRMPLRESLADHKAKDAD